LADKWDIRFLKLAREVASWSKDPSTQTGAVIVRPDRTIASVGFNGFPMKMGDAGYRYQNRADKYERIVHCEMNAILFSREPLKDYTLYTWPCVSCDRCAVHVIQSGISRVVSIETSEWFKARGWYRHNLEYFKEAKVEVVLYDERIFDREFKEPAYPRNWKSNTVTGLGRI
jgi:dCMP deaminase